ncbi:hypothetical protein [Lacicoccus qingdaonensis]|uniref:Uncharacterized protein n=1 Tax=Lacicoccus qingdaonensis TaxID=576118 RepID=A0A1G9FFU8_9BACL|nr:hypothetical protein [Salinicoccus qingdaonensis]SDK87250.1 hypothetical protein SAMN05216216_11219 [Salinicoccus qingdaonensis]
MESYKKTKERLLETEDYRSFIIRSRYLPGMMDKETAHFEEIQTTFKDEGFNHLSAVELCRSFIRVELLKLSLIQSTHGIFTEGDTPHYPTDQEVLDNFTLNKNEINFYELQLPEEMENINISVRNKIITFTKSMEPFLQLIEKNTGEFNDTFKTVMNVIINDNPHILSKVYDPIYYGSVLNYNIDNAFEKVWKNGLTQTALVPYYATFTLSYYDKNFKQNLT